MLNFIVTLFVTDKSKSIADSILWTALFILNIIYVLFLLIVAYYNRYALDDYCFLGNLNQYGFWGSIDKIYHSWQGRIFPYITINLVLDSQSYTSLFLYLAMVIAGYILGFIFFRRIAQKLSISIGRFKIVVFSFFTFNLFTIALLDFSTIYWLNVSAMYIVGLLTLLWAVAILIGNKISITDYCVLAILLAYTGTSSENLSVICILFIGIAGAIKYVSDRNVSFPLLYSFSVLVVSFTVMYLAPGNDIRRSQFPEPTLLSTIVISLKSFVQLNYYVGEKLSYLTWMSLPFIYFGSLSSFQTETNSRKLITIFTFSLIGFFILEYITVLPTAYATSKFGPLRAYNYISLLIVILIICLFVWMGAGNKKYADFFLYLSFLSLFIFSFHLYKLYAKNIPDTIRYVKSEEIKIKYMKDRKDMEVDPYEVPKVFRSEHVLLKYNEVRQGEEPWSVQCILSALRTEKFNKK
jgi:hypothetical protein